MDMDYHMIIASQGVVRHTAQNHNMSVDEFYATYGIDYFAPLRKLVGILRQMVSRMAVFPTKLAMQKPDLTSRM